MVMLIFMRYFYFNGNEYYSSAFVLLIKKKKKKRESSAFEAWSISSLLFAIRRLIMFHYKVSTINSGCIFYRSAEFANFWKPHVI